MMTHRWPRFLKLYLRLMVLGLGTWFAAYHLIDPYGTKVWGLEMSRAPLNGNQRFFTPLLAREERFDSAIVGDSTTLELRPDLINEKFGGSFVNLSLNGATPDENLTLLDVFVRFHPVPKTVIIRVSDYDCGTSEPPKRGLPPFPDALYDQNPLNDLSVSLSWETARVMVQQAGYALGKHRSHAALDGHDDPFEGKPVDPAGDAARIKAVAENMQLRAATATPRNSPDEFVLPGLHYLRSMLDLLPAETGKMLVFLPRAPLALPPVGSPDAMRWQACKERVADMARQYANTLALDMQYDSPLARLENAFHDHNHYYQPLADRIVEALAEVRNTRQDASNGVRVLAAPASAN